MTLTAAPVVKHAVTLRMLPVGLTTPQLRHKAWLNALRCGLASSLTGQQHATLQAHPHLIAGSSYFIVLLVG
jgi:hypothetical protein